MQKGNEGAIQQRRRRADDAVGLVDGAGVPLGDHLHSASLAEGWLAETTLAAIRVARRRIVNLVGAALLVPTILAVYSALRRSNEAFGALGAMVFFMDIAVYIASSRALPMLSLSRQYAAAATDAQMDKVGTNIDAGAE
jgi:hypothetical protein